MNDVSTLATASGSTRELGLKVAIITKVLAQPVLAALAGRFEPVMTSAADLQSGAPMTGVTVLVTDPGVGANAKVIASLPDLRLIAAYGVGVDAIDLAAAAERGIAVTNTPGLLTDDVADLALALMLASARDITASDRYVRGGNWTSLVAGVPLGRALTGKAVGIVGLGNIGAAIAKRAAAFNMRVSYHGPRSKPDLPYTYVGDLTEMAQDSDFLIVACRGGADTKGLVSGPVIDALGPTGTLVNVSRGSVVDEAALVDALASGRLGFAALDVFADEPNVPDALKTMPNVILTPHQGSATAEVRLAMAWRVLDNVTAFFEGRALPTPVIMQPAQQTQPGR